MARRLVAVCLHSREKEEKLQYLDLEISAAYAFGDIVKLRKDMLDRLVRTRYEAVARTEFLPEILRTDVNVVKKARKTSLSVIIPEIWSLSTTGRTPTLF